MSPWMLFILVVQYGAAVFVGFTVVVAVILFCIVFVATLKDQLL